ncbi:adenylate-forming enzyme AfeA [Aspergillus piperis CBS 112811]|uniref:Adenylate-forming enzyme AfeA n=1 Tax=Aspergillus piperis CBS 112811 TaxID=1448313 RepID=A0A8G1R5J0_9EURO|nr:adenylate-forming enzyme AfeA [Aspergillus piperis CBS 112811]RAH58125.1 adenylate-forming enzyme AfeA [Aspergillus piperis CBS 112811]
MMNFPTVHKDVLSFAFDHSVDYDESQPLYIDARNPSRSLNANQLRRLVRALIAGLRRYIKQGECVLVHLGNSYVHSALFFGIIGAGGVYMGASPDSPPHELANVLELGRPRLIITTNQTLHAVLSVATSKGLGPEQICLFEELTIASFLESNISYRRQNAGTITLYDLLACGEEDWIKFDDEALAKTTPAAMYCTSGTSGLPKAAIISHQAVVSQHLNKHYEVPYAVRRLVVVPVYHRFGALWHAFPIRQGEPAYFLQKFELNHFLDAVHSNRITDVFIVPAIVHLSLQSSRPVAELLSSLRMVGVSGAPIDTESLQNFQDLLHKQATAAQSWGMTETGPIFVCRYGERVDKGSIGKLVGINEARLIDDGGMIITSDNCPGELYVRGTGLFSNYKGRDDGVDADGWFRTGDVAYRQNEYYYLFGRVKEIIKVQGNQVAPAEIEAILSKHPGISDAAVLGVQSSDKSTELPRAFVVKSSAFKANLTADEVYQFAKSQLAGYKALDGGVVFVSDIPRTASGKILRDRLAQMNARREKIAQILSRRVIKVVT